MGRAPCCDKTNVKRGPWSPEEDATLTSYLERHGTGGNWIALPHKAGLRRCGKSCRLRWLNYLRPDIKHGCFTQQEDNIICTLYNNIGSRWSVIASHLPGRTDNDVKNHWNTKLKKKLQFVQQQQQFTTTTTTQEESSSSAPTTLPPALPPLPKVKTTDQALYSTTPNLFSLALAMGMEFSSYDDDQLMFLISSEVLLPAAAPFPIMQYSMIQLPPHDQLTTDNHEYSSNTNWQQQQQQVVNHVVSPVPEDGYSSTTCSSSTSAADNINCSANSINASTGTGGDLFLEELGFASYSDFLGGFGVDVAPLIYSSSSTKPQALYQN